MFTIQGAYSEAFVYTTELEPQAHAQILELCNQPFTKGQKIAIMPDVHAGKGCTIGTTMTITDKIVANLVGVDIGCGMLTSVIPVKTVDFEVLDQVIRNNIPSGFDVRENIHPLAKDFPLKELRCVAQISEQRTLLGCGTLGGGNHFHEVNQDEQGNLYFVTHSGSRNLGKRIADYYQDLAIRRLNDRRHEINALVKRLKSEGRENDIQAEVAKLKKQTPSIPNHLAYLEGQDMLDYLHDMNIAQMYADLNRQIMHQEVFKHMGWDFKKAESFTTMHNYINMEKKILRKGAISAELGEKVLIPMNMRDGSLLAIGKGNPDWNCSAPHGAGRILSRSKAKEILSFSKFEEEMKDVWSTSVKRGTLDESPMAYKPMEEILSVVGETATILACLRPLYNFKSS